MPSGQILGDEKAQIFQPLYINKQPYLKYNVDKPKVVLPESIIFPSTSHDTNDAAVTSLNNNPNGFKRNSALSELRLT